MKYLYGEFYVEVKDPRYVIQPTENFLLRKRDPPTSLGTQNQVQNGTQIRKTQKLIRDDNYELIVKISPENKQPIQQQPKFELPKCPNH